MIRIDVRPRKRNSHRADAEKRCPGHLQWLRGRPCAIASSACGGQIVAAHVDYAGNKGMSTKTEDWHAIPLCDWHHREQHGRGWKTFEADHGLDAEAVAAAYWRQSPHRVKYEAHR